MSSVLRRLSASVTNRSSPFGITTSSALHDLPVRVKDDVFRWQLGAKDFTCIDADTLVRAEICGNQAFARKVLAACHSLRIIDPTNGRPDTTKIDRNLVSKMPAISLAKQRELVLFLFWWEEELSRWRLISAEEGRIQRELDADGISESQRLELQQALKLVRGHQRVWPSKRNESGEVIRPQEEPLPTYDQVRSQTYE